MEDMGFSERGEAWQDVLDGAFDLDGRLPVNPDGGLKSFGHPVGASGLRMLFECWLQFRGEAGDRQLDDPKLGPDAQPRRPARARASRSSRSWAASGAECSTSATSAGTDRRRRHPPRRDHAVRRPARGHRSSCASSGCGQRVDLREPIERRLDPSGLDGLGIDLREFPLVDGRIDLRTLKGLEDLYREMLDRCGERMAGAVRLLCEGHPAVFFCSAGKDRTGLITALILSGGRRL